ncbi:hypothetical protein PAXRUDRAFT_21705 [Paxillus rubicundulus Ve08.2h10]|uniref:Uncharacterized protein n=1 Tax=Paxillus rubicundulus Ve08.2h10 TaxID=930991 RepID=A0A0D0CYX0_9AGAM|nr:hypothetical protein PAXRUDRAFT_21705 [Paxillus rubicundulus Ve08.2h10]
MLADVNSGTGTPTPLFRNIGVRMSAFPQPRSSYLRFPTTSEFQLRFSGMSEFVPPVIFCAAQVNSASLEPTPDQVCLLHPPFLRSSAFPPSP